MSFISIKDEKGEEVLINPNSIAYVSPIINQATHGSMWANVFFLGSNEAVTFDVDYYELKKLLTP